MGGHLVLEIVFRHISEIGKEAPTLAAALTLHWGKKGRLFLPNWRPDITFKLKSIMRFGVLFLICH